MEFYFSNPKKQLELKAVIDSWMHTPFRHHCGVKGLGCDCIHFVARVFEELGILRWRRGIVPDYPRDWHLHNTRELLLERMIKEFRGVAYVLTNDPFDREKLYGFGALVVNEPYAPMNGDVLLSHYGQAASHAALYFGGHIYQAVEGIGVCRIHFSDPTFRRQMRFAYRLIA